MLIRSTQTPPKTAATLLSDTFRAAREGRRVTMTEAEERRIALFLANRAKRWEAEIENRLAAGDLRAAYHKVDKHLRQRSSRLWALSKAQRGLPTERKRSVSQLVPMVKDVDVFQRWPSGRILEIEKRDRPGETRTVSTFGLTDRACSILLKSALTSFARAHPIVACHSAQTLMFGGRPVACERLLTALRSMETEGWFVQLDVRNFYGSIASEELQRVIPLDPRILQRHIAASGNRPTSECSPIRGIQRESASTSSTAAQPRRARDNTRVGGGLECRNAGIVQGAAASTSAAEMIMGNLLKGIGQLEGVRLIVVYSDNIGLLADTEASAASAADILTRRLQEHSGGPFHIGRKTISSTTGWFRFLGYEWRGRGLGVQVRASTSTTERFRLEFGEKLLRLSAGGDRESADKLQSSLRSFCSSFPLWRDRDDFTDELSVEIEHAFLEGVRQRAARLPIRPFPPPRYPPGSNCNALQFPGRRA